jgi:8-oxo-dGTP pyrophosphatase MutT (NUDIX family)
MLDAPYQISTAGVYVCVAGCFPFQVGLSPSGETLGVVRLGGHREEGETGWQCAVREAFEEAHLQVLARQPPATYWVTAADEATFQPGPWLVTADEVAPFLAIANPDGTVTPMYLGVAEDEPIPSAEAKGLLLLRPDHIQQLVEDPLTLGQYLASGGSARFRERLPYHLVLEPFRQLRLLRTLLHLHPEVAQLSEHSA